MRPAESVNLETESLSEFYTRVRSHTKALCEPLEIEDYIPQPVVDVSPPKWNIAHTTWFFEEMVLKRFVRGYQVFDADFGFLFNSYYNSIGDRTPRDHRSLSRPTVKRVFEYREYVDEQMLAFLSEPGAIATGFSNFDDGKNPVAIAPGSDLVILGLNHEQQHQELFLTDLKYTFGLNPLFPVYRDGFTPEIAAEAGTRTFIEVTGGDHAIGHAGDGFCFDNELARHTVRLDDFEIGSRLVTNLDFLKFINDGGYRDHRLWHSEGWDWVNQNAIDSPLHWHRLHDHSDWYQFTLGGLRKLRLDAPVCHISYYEAAAFAEWKGMRLPTEFEWEAANSKFDWGLRWEWTNSAYLPYPGFRKPDGAVGEYNGKFMINQMVLRGASVATPEGHSRPTYRNFFHPHLRWQFTGMRLAR
ncbi:MAG: ergothioneine biosynthesis protein EgtB [Pyrinomonadaceae bacterium]